MSVLFKLKLREKEAHVGPIHKLRGKFVELFPRSKAQPNVWHASTIFGGKAPVGLPCLQLFADPVLIFVKDLNIALFKFDQSLIL